MRLSMLLVALAAPLSSGCALQKRAQNPLPGVFRVAVIPFNDKTNGQPGIDTMRITEIFASELQKIPTYEVVSVQEVREAIGPWRVPTNQPELAFAVARAVHAQAVIVGDVTEYECYYPPRIGLHCEMYAMVTGEAEAVIHTLPPVPVPAPPGSGLSLDHGGHIRHGKKGGKCGNDCVPPPPKLPEKPACDAGCGPVAEIPKPNAPWIQGSARPRELAARQGQPKAKTPASAPAKEVDIAGSSDRAKSNSVLSNASAEEKSAAAGAVADAKTRPAESGVQQAAYETSDPAVASTGYINGELPPATAASVRADIIPAHQLSSVRLDTALPVVEPWVIRHSRIFDGLNGGYARKLNDYHFFNKDERGGEWWAYTHRMEDFNRFACNRMIYEMLKAAGGPWTSLRGVRIPQPWQPWPWR